ncbi:PadR family transcriptional regulator [Patescibacteria group bacterium]|nr:PadR family transcriptional regulator [Patescibacteria group bacterium]
MNVDNWKTQLKKGISEMIILNILQEKTGYGLEIVKSLEENEEIALTEGTIYPILSRLKAEGLVFTEWIESEQGRQRKYYSLSEKGRKVCKSLNEAWYSFIKNVDKIINSGKGGKK